MLNSHDELPASEYRALIQNRVSVIMPCFNHGSFIKKSAKSILNQTYTNLELIIIDDASADNSLSVIQELAKFDNRIKLIVHGINQGASRSRNDGLRVATGEYVAFCDADDLWKINKLEYQVGLLSKNKEFDITYCDSEIINGNGLETGKLFSDLFPIPAVPSGDLFESLCTTNFINIQTVLARKSVFNSEFKFDETIRWVEDWWLWIRLSRKHQFLYTPSILAQYRVHQDSTALTQKQGIRRHRWKVFKRNLKTHNDIPFQIQAEIRYQMGVDLCLMKKRRHGCELLWQALHCGFTGRIHSHHFLKIILRTGWEWTQFCFCAVSNH